MAYREITTSTFAEITPRIEARLSEYDSTSLTRYLSHLGIAKVGNDEIARQFHAVDFQADMGTFKCQMLVRQRLVTTDTGNEYHIDVLDRSGWTSLMNWLLSLPDVFDGNASNLVGDAGRQNQQNWWSVNGKEFPLLQLPSEIQDKIFRAAIGDRIIPGTTPSGDIDHANPRRNLALVGNGEFENDLHNGFNNSFNHTIVERPNRSLLLLSHGVRRATQGVVWKTSRLWFPSINHFRQFYDHGSIILPFQTMRKICLELSMAEWALWTGIPIDPGWTRPDWTFKQTIPQLDDLQIYFKSPKHNLTSRDTTPDALLRVLPCQKMAVDSVLAYLWPMVKDIGKIHLTGTLKNSSLKRWTHIHKRYRFTNGKEEPDLEADMFLMSEAIRLGHLDCKCRSPCAFPFPPGMHRMSPGARRHFESYRFDPDDAEIPVVTSDERVISVVF